MPTTNEPGRLEIAAGIIGHLQGRFDDGDKDEQCAIMDALALADALISAHNATRGDVQAPVANDGIPSDDRAQFIHDTLKECSRTLIEAAHILRAYKYFGSSDECLNAERDAQKAMDILSVKRAGPVGGEVEGV